MRDTRLQEIRERLEAYNHHRDRGLFAGAALVFKNPIEDVEYLLSLVARQQDTIEALGRESE